MSFYLPFTKAADSTEMLLAPGSRFYAEGQAVVRTNSAESAGVIPSTGTATDVFCGFSFAGTSALPFPETYYNKVEQFVVSSTGAVTLSLTPIAGQYFVFDTTTNSSAQQGTLAGNQITGLTAGDTVNVTYKYVMTVVQARALYGDIQPGGYIGDYVGQIGVVTRGTIYTTEYDDSENWAATTGIWLAANGQITGVTKKGTNAVQIPNAYVVAIPGQDVPFLGISFSAA